MSQDIPNEIYNFIQSCVHTYEETTTTMEYIYHNTITSNSVNGSGFCIKILTKGLTHESAGSGRSIINFTISDGEYSVECIAHNAQPDYLSNPMTDEELTNFLIVLTNSQKRGKRVDISGHYINYGKKRIFLCKSITIDEGLKESQMSKEQFLQFKSICKKFNLSPLDLMLSDQTIWGEIYAKEFLKKAIMLFCMNPLKKQDMIHIGLVSAHGEGKDHLVERVIQPLVPCRMAGSGKMSTIPGLFGAMSGDDLNTIEIGLLPKMNHERVAVSEFQTWGDETFGELMNMMANGKIEMQKGALDVVRETNLNLLFMGNPPHYYDEDKHDKRVMLDAFGQYTYQIISRLTLIFTQLSLSGGSAIKEIRNSIISAIDEDFSSTGQEIVFNNWRAFFREYLRYVSKLNPKLRDYVPRINSTYDEIEARPQFQNAFCIRSSIDNRKYQEFANLVKAFARLYGDDKINWHHLSEARDLFEISLQTLTEEFPLAAMIEGVDNELIEIYKKLMIECPIAESIKELKGAVRITNNQLDVLIRSGAITKFDDGKYFINDGWLDKMQGGA